MITIKKKKIFVFFFIIFFINVFLVGKRRDFNLYNLKFIFDNEKIGNINKNSNTVTKDNNYHGINPVSVFLKKNKIEELNFDEDLLIEKNNGSTSSVADIIFYLYPTKFNNKSNYVISYLNDSKYNKCKLMIPKPTQDENLNNKFLTIYLCE